MKLVKYFNALSLILLIPMLSVAQMQGEELSFEETTHDFGTIDEVAGPVEFEFKFVNNSGQNIQIENVKASCGCTTPGWSEEAISPGSTGFVKARYDPRNRPGPFNKSLTITTSGKTKRYVVYIKGLVNPKPLTIEDELPTLMGGLRVKYRAFNLGRTVNNSPVTKEFEVYNASEGVISFVDSINGPDYIKVDVQPKELKPEEKGRIIVTYDVVAKNDLGYMNDNVALFTNEIGTEAKKSFSVYVNIEEYFPPMTTEELANAPKLSIEEAVHDFGKLSKGDVVEASFSLQNTGKTALNIRKIASSCSCAVASMDNLDLQPGEQTDLKVRFDSNGRRGTQQKSITIFSNDPKAPTQRVVIKATINQ